MIDYDFWEEQEMAEREYDAMQYEIARSYDDGYEQGRIDTLKECYDNYTKMGYGFFEEWIAEQLKEYTKRP